MEFLILSVVLAPLVGAALAGAGAPLARAYAGEAAARRVAHTAAIAGVAWSFVGAAWTAREVFAAGAFDFDWFVWARFSDLDIGFGFLVDNLTCVMLLAVSFVSLMVHIYTIGYMAADDGYCRFFVYISFFTFAMLALVSANNFMQLFLGWEAVGLASYLLIGFWFTRESAIRANLKAFLVNRVGDFGFLIGIGLALAWCGSLDYAEVFAAARENADARLAVSDSVSWHLPTAVCLALFLGAMGKSAQFPLHVWLPDSMEGPTPISALIHAATMVTAGVFMVARLSPLYELSEAALSVVLFVGAVTAFFAGLLGLVQNDIKRVVAYSTLSQLGYMTAALGASAYSAAIFHLLTHAFFKALLFLAAGSVIIALHHEQDLRRMGGLREKMPITYVTAVLGTLALCGLPPFSGFFSKDIVIDAVAASVLPGAGFARWALIAGAFVTALYSFRLLFLAFHGSPRDEKLFSHARESPKVVTIPLVLLAVPSVVLGGVLFEPMLFDGFFADSIYVREAHDTVATAGTAFDSSARGLILHSVFTPAFWLALAGVGAAWVLYRARPEWPGKIAESSGVLRRILLAKYGFDDFNERALAAGTRGLSRFLGVFVDTKLIDGFFVGGAARLAVGLARAARRLQTGMIYHYAFSLLLGVAFLLFLLLTPWRNL